MCLADIDVARAIVGERLRSSKHRSTTRRKTRAAATARASCLGVALLALLVLGGCGDDDGDTHQTTAAAITGAAGDDATSTGSGSTADRDEPSADPASDETRIRATLTGLLKGGDAKNICSSVLTARFLKRSYGNEQGCVKAQSPKAAAKKVRIGAIAITQEGTATTSVKAKGGLYDGERVKAVLVLQDGDWRVDSLRSNVPVGP